MWLDFGVCLQASMTGYIEYCQRLVSEAGDAGTSSATSAAAAPPPVAAPPAQAPGQRGPTASTGIGSAPVQPSTSAAGAAPCLVDIATANAGQPWKRAGPSHTSLRGPSFRWPSVAISTFEEVHYVSPLFLAYTYVRVKERLGHTRTSKNTQLESAPALLPPPPARRVKSLFHALGAMDAGGDHGGGASADGRQRCGGAECCHCYCQHERRHWRNSCTAKPAERAGVK
jgi:hypothetical protein